MLAQLARLVERDLITPAEASAGARFAAMFQRAGLDRLRVELDDLEHLGAVDLGRWTYAKSEVWQALRDLGGLGQRHARLAWIVLGWGWPLTAWARAQRLAERPLHAATVRWTLRRTLATLANGAG